MLSYYILKLYFELFQSDQNIGSLKEELRRILPQVEEMRKRKIERRNQFIEVLEQIHKVTNEIYGSLESVSSTTVVDEIDLSLRKLEELHLQLHELQKEKVNFFFFSFNSSLLPGHESSCLSFAH